MSTTTFADSSGQQPGGVLDLPLPSSIKAPQTNSLRVPPALGAANPQAAQQALRKKLKQEQKVLKTLPRAALQKKANKGERAAQVALAEDFAKESALLAFAPMAANDALSDAVRWYSLAAKRGFPGAPSLDQAGVQFYPIRVQRSR